ncbi:DUF1987 domain-containing protein [Algivirga pacifica]|uniref:DUF1987 domain-containing protein n=1 Tax=Algivirga pacifica TaxID=1162670 RepID=A0ABP9D670_9BACT
MKNFILPEKNRTPRIELDRVKGLINIVGRSIPENAVDFYKPVLDWIELYKAEKPQIETTVNMQLDYFNTATSKCFIQMFRSLEELHQKGHQIVVNWYYEEEDEDIEESGRDFIELLNLPFNLVVMESNY